MSTEQHLEKAYKIISSMFVNGDNQDFATVAKSEIRAALEDLRKAEKEDTNDGG